MTSVKLHSLSKVFVVFSILVLLFSIQDIKAQISRDGILEINGWLFDDNDNPIKKAKVVVFQDNSPVFEAKTNRRGKFIIELPIDKNYIAEFSYDGYATKKMSFNTLLPNEFDGFNVFYFEFIVELFPFSPGVDYALLESPIIEVAYLDDKEQFFFEEQEARPILAKVEDLKEQSYKMLELRKDYDLLLETADMMFEQNDYKNAVSNYNKALDYFPDEEYPRNQIKQILASYEPEDNDSYRHLADATDNEEVADNQSDENETFESDVVESSDIIAEDIIEQSILENSTIASEENSENLSENTQEDKSYLAENESVSDNKAIDNSSTELADNTTDSFEYDEEFEEDDIDYEQKPLPTYNVIGDKSIAYFDFASYNLNDESLSTINNAISYLKNNPDVNLVIYGHSDRRGNPLFNFYLSQLRAQITYDYCVANGINPERMVTLAYGQNNPQLENAVKESEHKLNRRVELEFIDNESYADLIKQVPGLSFSHLNDLQSHKSFSEDVEYMVQFIISKPPVGTSFFHKILTEYSDTDIIYYYDNTEYLHRYLIGSYKNISDATKAAIKLQGMGYDVYVVAFSDGKRISVSQANLLLGDAG
ncbi:MAG: OmpA family protein [Bacteroidota bacterium]